MMQSYVLTGNSMSVKNLSVKRPGDFCSDFHLLNDVKELISYKCSKL
jgi:hypothetical protein